MMFMDNVSDKIETTIELGCCRVGNGIGIAEWDKPGKVLRWKLR